MRTLVIGASPNPYRFSHRVTLMLQDYGHEVIPLGIRVGSIGGLTIRDMRQKPLFENIHTITLYLHPRNQVEWYQYMLDLSPKRLIFNPGAENPEFAQMAVAEGIQVENACTLVMLAANTYVPA